MVSIKRLINIAVFSISALFSLPLWASLNVTVDRNPINLEDTVQITIEATSDVSGSPDLAPLKEKFDILGINQSSSFSFGTGQGSRRSIKRIVTAQAKEAGMITIPAIQWGSLSSSPLTLKVLEAAQQASGSDLKAFYVEASLENPSPYVQEQTVLTLKAYSNKQFSRGGFSELNMPSGLVAKSVSKQDDVYQTSINGVAYMVQERKFLISAERSGSFTIDPVIFQGQFPSGQRDLFGQYQLSSKRIRSNALTLEAKAIPSGAKQPWLPAKQVTLSHFLSDGEYKVGEPITLTLSTIADGLVGEQIPDIKLNLPDGLKSYPDQPETETSWNNGSVLAKRTDKIAIIPVQGGSFTLPPITLHWWNTETNQAETATIDSIKFSVTGSVPALKKEAPVTTETNNAEPNTAPAVHASNAKTGNLTLWKGLTLLFAALWLVTLRWLIVKWRKPTENKTSSPVVKQTTLSRQQLIKQLKTADAKTAAQQLVLWAQGELDADIYSIGQIQPYADRLLGEALKDLSQALYGNKASGWSSVKLIEALDNFKATEGSSDKDRTALSLYPE